MMNVGYKRDQLLGLYPFYVSLMSKWSLLHQSDYFSYSENEGLKDQLGYFPLGDMESLLPFLSYPANFTNFCAIVDAPGV
jgi:hypothetical protein